MVARLKAIASSGACKVVMLLVLACVIRVLHIWTGGYHVINHDSFFFHQCAEWVGCKCASVPVQGSGLVYPLWFTGEVIGLETASIVLPLVLTVLMGLVLYWFAHKQWGQTIALWSLFAYVVAWPAIFAGYAGMLDRDLLCVLLVTIGMIGMHDGRLWLTVLAMIGLLVLWSWLGVAVLVTLIVGNYALHVALRKPAVIPASVMLCMGLAVLILVVRHDDIWQQFKWAFSGQTVQEAGHNPFYELAAYWSLVIPLGAGAAVMTRNKDHLFILSWALTGFLMGFIAQRLVIFAIPAMCVVVAFGMEFVWHRIRRVAVVCVVVAIILGLFIGIRPPANAVMSQDWADACYWLKDNAPPKAVVMSAWDNGFWIWDVAERTPYVHNGQHSPEQDQTVFGVYCATDEAACLVARDEVDYIVMSRREANYWESITARAGYEGPPEDTLYYRASRGANTDCLRQVYRNETVVILEVQPW